MDRPLILVVDADADVRVLVRGTLVDKGIETLGAASSPEALETLRTHPVRVLLLGQVAPGSALSEFLERASRLRPSVVPVLLGGDRSPEARVAALRAGAFDVLERPPAPSALEVLTERALVQHDLLEERRRLREEVRTRVGYDRMVGRSAAMERTRERVERLAAGDIRVHFIGEGGVGKGLAARTLHAMSPRSGRPFVELDCGAFPAAALEAELFGYERGALPGSDRRTMGALEAAEGGVVFLRDVGEVPLELQERLLRVLQVGQATRCGGADPFVIDVRVVSSSRRDLAPAVEAGSFREDLYHSLAAATVRVPPLRERPEDVALLVRHFVDTICEINEIPPIALSPEALSVMERYPWPGNVRELRNAVEQAVILVSDGTIRPRDLPDPLRYLAGGDEASTSSSRRFREAKRRVVEAFEKGYLEDLMARHSGNVTAAAQHAGMLRSALQRLLRKYDLRSSAFRRERRVGELQERT